MVRARRGEPALAGRRRVRRPPWSPTANRDEVRAYLQERMALLSKLLFWIFWALVLFVFALYEIYPRAKPADADIVHIYAVGGLFVMGGIWYVWLYARQSSIETLYRIDWLYALLIGIAFGLSAYYSSDQRANVYSAFIWHTFMVFARVIVVPSTGRRTAVVTSVSFVPLMTAAVLMAIHVPERLELPAPAFVTGSLLFAVVATLLATTGSRVIYGLRKQVRDAVHLGQYTLGRKLGEGGMGAVYEARHSMLRRPTAIKLLPPNRLAPASLERFEREVQMTSQLTHPNTIAVYDYGRSPDGVFYYAMEHLDGIDLERLVELHGAQPVDRVVRILRQVCGALEEAHGMGLVHRDIKPGNLLLCRRGRGRDVIKVLDFGLVTEIEGSDDTPAVLGTPAYVSPEAVTDPDSIGAHSDLYALGAVGYFVLTGHRVFEASTPLDLCVAHATRTPEPPSSRGVELPQELEALIMQCLEKAPGARPASAQALEQALAEVPPVGDFSEEQAAGWWRSWEATRELAAPAPSARTATITVDIAAR